MSEFTVRLDGSPERDTVVIRWSRPGEEVALVALSAPFVRRDLLVRRDTSELAALEVLVAELDGELVGCVGLAQCWHQLVVGNLCVADRVQGRGIGSRLLARVVEIAEQRGFGSLLAASRHSGEWFQHQGFLQVDAVHAPEWRTVLHEGRNSQLYRRASTRTEATPKENA